MIILWIYYIDIYCDDFKAREKYLCKDKKELEEVEQRYEKIEKDGDIYTDFCCCTKQIVEIKNAEQLLNKMTKDQLIYYMPDIKEAFKKFTNNIQDMYFSGNNDYKIKENNFGRSYEIVDFEHSKLFNR